MYNQLTYEERVRVDDEVKKRGKNIFVVYLLAFFLGTLGVHRFYMKKTFTGFIQLVIGVLGYLTEWLLIGYGFLFIVGLWVLIDMFLIPGWINRYNHGLREKFAGELIQNR